MTKRSLMVHPTFIVHEASRLELPITSRDSQDLSALIRNWLGLDRTRLDQAHGLGSLGGLSPSKARPIEMPVMLTN